ncbi:DUF4286 family protein [Montanilutibacter psychrotolerans]|uniref:DUF4286 family protein n=1 Tax=Montanilutibacter psychrotolerans TaxID=1327343 RepID=UPI001681B59E|nr:DUF4286 family protein [Lysobacter psychrotolerans]
MSGVIYEVNLDIDAAIEHDYRAWLAAHIDEILALPGFTAARLFEQDEPAAEPGRLRLCVQYTLVDATALATYLAEHAPRMRGEGIARFGTRFSATRRVLRETTR